MKYLYIFSSLLFFSSQIAYAQPANDDCAGAISVATDGSCVSGTTVLANDSWTGTVGCQSGAPNSHEDVWYSFVATGTQATIDATATGAWTGNVEIILVDGTCATSFTILGATCGVSPQSLSYNGLTVGVTYYYTISNDASGTNGTFDVCTNNITPPAGCIDNDLCSAPQVLALTSGVQSCLTDCNTGASNGPDFAGANCEDMLNPTVWYEVTSGASDVTMDITLNSTDFTDPEFVVFQSTDCISYTIINCTEGTGGTAAANFTISPSSTYLIAVSDATGDEGSFDLCVTVSIDNSPCNTNSDVTVTATSMGSPLTGPFEPGEVISFCYNITDWQTGASCNYLSGIVPTFGSGWDAASFDANGMPVSITTPLATAGVIQPGGIGPPVAWAACVGETAGTWSWFNAGVVLYNDLLLNTGTAGALPDGTPLPAGWFFLTNYDPATGSCTPNPTDPNNSYGDNNFAKCSDTLDWSVCFDLTVGALPNCSAGLVDLSVSFQTYSDGETGAWNSVGCVGNIAQVSPAVMNCCLASAIVSGGGSYCQGTSPTGMNVQFDFTGTGPWTLSYTDGVTPTTVTTSSNPYIITDVTAGVYSVTNIDDVNCTGTFSGSATVTEIALDDATFSYGATSYCRNAADPTPTVTGTPGGTFSSTAGLIISSGTGLIDVSVSTPATYTITYLTNGLCPVSSTFDVTIVAVDNPSFSYAAASYCQNGVDPTPTITGTLGGTFSAGAGLIITPGTGLIDLSASTPGVYTVTYLTSGICPASTTFGITIVATDDASFTYGAISYCQDAADPTPTITGTPGGTFSSTVGLTISSGTGLIDVSTSTVGSYVVTYLTAGTCPVSSTFNLDILAVDNPSFSYAAASYCQNGVDPTPTITGTLGGTFSAGVGLSIIAGTGAIDLSTSTPGAYTVTYLTGGVCPVSTTFGITIVIADDASFTYTSASYCQNGVDPTPTITGTLGGTFSAGSGLSISAGTGVIDLSTSTAGVYTVTYLTAGACPASATFGITVTATDDASFSYSSGTYCLTGADPIPTITGLAGGTFTATAGLVINAATGEVGLLASGIGNYTVTYTTNGPCPTFMDFPLSITSSPDATFSYTGTPYCEGSGFATVTYGAGASGGDFTSTAGLVINLGTGAVNLTTSTPGVYTVDNNIAAAGGCAAASASTSIEIIAADNPAFAYSAPSFCQDAANPLPTITGTSGGSFSSTAGLAITSGTGLIDLASSTIGTYDVTYTTAGACPTSSINSVTVNGVDNPSFTYSAVSYCQDGANPTPTVTGTPGGGFSSTAGLSINAVTGVVDVAASTPGLYTVTYLTVGTCPASAPYDITIVAVDDPTFAYSAPSFCQDAANPSPTISGTAGGTFSSTAGLNINAGTGLIDLAASTAGSYDVTYLTAGICPASTTFSVTITAVDNSSFAYATSVYCQDGINPTPNITGLGGGTFSSTAGLLIAGGTGTIDLAGSTVGSYVITYTTGGSCPTSTIFNMDIVGVDNPSFTYTASVYCQNESNQLPTVTGTAGGTYSSAVGLSINTVTGEIDLAASTPGAYDVTYLTGGTCPASTTFSVTITAVDNPGFTYSSNAFCMADTNPFATITGTPGGVFSMNSGGIINAINGEINISGSGAGIYTVYYSTSGMCPAIDSTSITITNQLDATITLSGPYCSDAVVDTLIAATTGGTWSGPGMNAVTGEFDPVIAGVGTHDIVYVLVGSCGASDTVQVVVSQANQANISAAGPYCSDALAEILTVDTVGGIWSGIGINSVTGEFDPVVAGVGTWEIIYSPVGTCMNNDTIQIVVNQTPTADAGADVSIVSGASTTLTGTGGGSYIWTPSTDLSCSTCPDPIAGPLTTTTYILTVSSNSCFDTDSVIVTVAMVEDNAFFVPNIFSPNGDGNNDVFLVEGSGLSDFNLKIFNRWGEMIFESDNQSNGWDGTQKGERLNAGVFVYLIKYIDSNNEEQVITGNVTLIK